MQYVALWAITDDSRLSEAARGRLLAPGAVAFVSRASLWKIAIKHSLGRGEMPVGPADAARYFARSGFVELPVTWAHTLRAASLPPLHRDPFVRLLVARALEEPLTLLTDDVQVAAYSDALALV